MKLTWQCMFSPRLYKIYKEGPRESLYQPKGFEKWGDRIITMANTIMNIGFYTSPFICMYIYRRGFFTVDECKTLAKFFGGVGCLIAIAYLMRGIGRASNPVYLEFLHSLQTTKARRNLYINSLRRYDFDFNAWPVSFAVSPKRKSPWLQGHPFSQCANNDLPLYQRKMLQVLAYLATHTFALRLIYPGSLGLIHTLFWDALFQGRAHLVEAYEAKRTKLKTTEGNDIDTMFIDNRMITKKGDILVICCEGNSGFYEIGIMTTPAKAGYSALGWNHPGFAGSTGVPYPEQEQNAIDTVMQYALNYLKFEPENIIMFGWSIGGYTATWAAVYYPVRALVLDATFDDLLPLAQNQMPSSWALLVKEVVRSYVDLNVGELLEQYDGPVQLVRRTEDEIICIRPGMLSSNRGNHLLLRILQARHPEIFTTSTDVVANINNYISLLDTQRIALTRTDISDVDREVLELISRYMRDYKSTHCTPLPENVFESIIDNITNSNG